MEEIGRAGRSPQLLFAASYDQEMLGIGGRLENRKDQLMALICAVESIGLAWPFLQPPVNCRHLNSRLIEALQLFHFSSRRGHQLEPSESKGVAQPVEPLSHGT